MPLSLEKSVGYAFSPVPLQAEHVCFVKQKGESYLLVGWSIHSRAVTNGANACPVVVDDLSSNARVQRSERNGELDDDGGRFRQQFGRELHLETVMLDVTALQSFSQE